jgi:hypothetical protein
MKREVEFTEDMVTAWCMRNNAELNGEESFDEKTVPHAMLLDQLQPMAYDIGDEEAIIQSMTAHFRDPVFIGETVEFEITDIEEKENHTGVDFEARVKDRGMVVSMGGFSVVINGDS